MSLIGRIALVSMLALAAAPAFAADPTQERLVVLPYPASPAWHQVASANPKTSIWLPAGVERPGEGNDLLSAQTFREGVNIPVEKFARDFAPSSAGACTKIDAKEPRLTTENGFPVAYVRFHCANFHNESIDVDCFMKVIGGKDAIYVVQRIFRSPAVADAVVDLAALSPDQKIADDFLVQGVRLCGPTDGDGICAPAAALAPAAAEPPPDPDSLPPFINGKSTVDDVVDKFGRPDQEGHLMGPDGPFNYTYIRDGGNLIVVFLFGKDRVLIRVRAYQKNQ
jgi:hypothetical protein